MECRNLLEDHLRECYGRVVYSHKTHEKCADILSGFLRKIKLCQIVLSSLTTVGFAATLFGAGPVGAAIGLCISAALLCLNTYIKDHSPEEIAQKHRQAAINLWLVREKYLTLIIDLRVGKEPIEKIANRRDVLLVELHNIYSGAPSTNHKAYRKAQKALKYNEEMTFSADEIDSLLPSKFRKSATPDEVVN